MTKMVLAGYSSFAVVNRTTGKSCHDLDKLAGYSVSAVVVNDKTEISRHDENGAGRIFQFCGSEPQNRKILPTRRAVTSKPTRATEKA
jgi:hypothetical protein